MSDSVWAALRVALGNEPYDDTYIEDRVCACGHADFRHAKKRRACQGPDSYGLPCRCPGFELDEETSVNPHGK